MPGFLRRRTPQAASPATCDPNAPGHDLLGNDFMQGLLRGGAAVLDAIDGFEAPASWLRTIRERHDCPTPADGGPAPSPAPSESTVAPAPPSPVTPARPAAPPAPAPDAPVASKHAFYVHVLDVMGHAGAVPTDPGTYALVGLRGVTRDHLASMKVENTPGQYDDLFVIVGLDAQGAPFVREYPGSTDPGRFAAMSDQWNGLGENWMMKEGEYDYQYAGARSASVGGGDHFVMTASQVKDRGVDLYVDRNRDDQFHGPKDEQRNEKGNYNFLIHRGGADPSADVGPWSAGCQVIAGKNAQGKLNMDEAASFLKQNPGGKTKYVLIDGAQLARRLSGA
jgi:hypothetical protein